MSYAYMLAGDDLELAEAELEAFLRSQSVEEEPARTGRVAETETEPDQLKRLGLVHEVSEIIQRGNMEGIEDAGINYRPEGSFAVRVENLSEIERDKKEIERRIGTELETDSNSVDLERPEEVIRVYLLEEKFVVGRRVVDIDRSLFDKRKNQNRPFSSPVSLDPITARVMVNLAEVSAGEHILDPFCGTGGILIEAGLCGIGVHGLDIKQEMVEGAQENLEEYGIIVHDIKQYDITEENSVFDQDFSAILTDLPYGQASKVEGDPVEQFLDEIEVFNGKTVFMYNEPDLGGYEADFEIYVHKNLTRYIYVLD